MILTKDDWIRVGAGKLFGAPFLSRALLYRLHDVKCSILVYHDKPHTLLSGSDLTATTGFHESSTLVAKNVVVAKEKRETPAISVHYCTTSCSLTYEALAKLPAKRLSIKQCGSIIKICENIAFCVEPYSLPFSRRRLVSYPGLSDKRLITQDGKRTIVGPVDITAWPRHIPIDNIQMRCWKIRLYYEMANSKDEVIEHGHCSLTALDVSEDGHLNSALYLENL